MTDHPLVSVIIPHYQDITRLDLCLSDLYRQTFPADQFEVIVSDNASPVGEAAVAVVIAGRAKLVITTEKGAGPARNAGAAVARGEILAFTDSDCRPEPEWLSEGVAALNDYNFVGGRMRVLAGDSRHFLSGAEAFERVFAFDNETYVKRKGFTVTANLFCSRRVFEKVGQFRSGVSEDNDWSHRALKAGYRLDYAPKAVVGHPARRNWEELKVKWRRVDREQYALAKINGTGAWRWVARCLLLPISAVIHTPKVLFSKDLTCASERLKGLTVLYRLRFWRVVDSVRIFLGT